MKKNTGKSYENFVADIQKSILATENHLGLTSIEVEINKKLTDRSGLERQFDVYWEFSLGGQTYKTVIECKDYESKISLEKIDAFLSKTSDIPGLKLIYATKTGYQSGAKTKAEQHNIDLLVIREANENDFISEDGEALVKSVELNIIAISPPRIREFIPVIDQDWLDEQVNINLDEISEKFRQCLNIGIFLVNGSTGEKISLHRLAQLLPEKIPNIEYGNGSYHEELRDTYLEDEQHEVKLKLRGYKLNYTYLPPITNKSAIDLAENLLGIIEKYSTMEKKMVYKKF